MIRFDIVYQKNGREIAQVIEAYSIEDLLNDKKLPNNIITIRRQRIAIVNKMVRLNFNKTTIELDFINELNILLKAKISFFESINLINSSSTQIDIKIMTDDMIHNLKCGKTLHEIFLRHKYFLSQLAINFFELGEKSGNIEQAVRSLHTVLTLKFEQTKKIKEALAYPIFLLVVTFMALIAIFKFVLPEFRAILENYSNLPVLTRFLFFIDDLFVFEVVIGFCIILVFFGMTIFLSLKKENIRFKMYEFILKRIPLISKIIYFNNMYILFLVMYEQMKSKYKLQETLQFSILAIDNLYLQTIMKQSLENLNYGISFSQTLQKQLFFDNIMIKLVKVAEETNNYQDIFFQLHNVFKTKLNDRIKYIVLMFEPIFISVIAIVVLVVALGVFIPMWDFSQIIK